MWRVKYFSEWVSYVWDTSFFGKGTHCENCGIQSKSEGAICICRGTRKKDPTPY